MSDTRRLEPFQLSFLQGRFADGNTWLLPYFAFVFLTGTEDIWGRTTMKYLASIGIIVTLFTADLMLRETGNSWIVGALRAIGLMEKKPYKASGSANNPKRSKKGTWDFLNGSGGKRKNK